MKAAPLMERFMRHVAVQNDGCWLWTGTVNQNGYGTISTRRERSCRTSKAHRIAYELLVGSIPEGLDLDHKCRVRRCVNPEHLEAVTRKENIGRGLRGARVFCPQGHPYSPDNVLWRKNGAAKTRICRTCNRERCRERYQKSRVA